jgi:hypothetical protein
MSYALIFILVMTYFHRRTGNGFSRTLVLRGEELRNLSRLIRPVGSAEQNP